MRENPREPIRPLRSFYLLGRLAEILIFPRVQPACMRPTGINPWRRQSPGIFTCRVFVLKDFDFTHPQVIAHLVSFHHALVEPKSEPAESSYEKKAVMGVLKPPRQRRQA